MVTWLEEFAFGNRVHRRLPPGARGAVPSFGTGPQWQANLSVKQPGTYRILVFGGSTVVGVPVKELGFVAQLEAGFRYLEPAKGLEVVNLGKSGWPSDQVGKILEHTIDGEPDLIIVLSAHNEFLERAGDDSSLQSSIRRALLYSAFARFLDQKVLKPLWWRLEQERLMPQRLTPYNRDAQWFQERVRGYRSNLRKIIGLAQSHKVPLFLVTGPSNVADWPPIHRDIAWAVSNPNYDANIKKTNALLKKGFSWRQKRRRIDCSISTARTQWSYT